MDNWEKLKQEIEIETHDYFKDKGVNVGELVNLLQKVLMARVFMTMRIMMATTLTL